MKVIVPILLVFVAIAVLCAHTNLPWSDEAWFASPALNLITNGNFGTSVLDPTASFRTNNLTGIREHTYWIVPLFPLAEAAWFRAIGFGLMQVRYLSILWGLVALWAWYRMLKILSGDERVAVLALGLMAVDFTFAWTASVGRMDMMAAALGGAGLTAFLILRERNFTRAVLVSQSLIVAAGLTHPMAAGYCLRPAGAHALQRLEADPAAACPGGGGALRGGGDRVGTLYHAGSPRFHAAIRRQRRRARTADHRPDGHPPQPGHGALPLHVRHGAGYQGLQPHQDSDSGGVCGGRSGRGVESGIAQPTRVSAVCCWSPA